MEKLKLLIESMINILLPKDSEVSEIEMMTDEEIMNVIEPANDIKDCKYKALFQYKNKIMRRGIWEIKYKGNKKIAGKFAKLLYNYILDDISDEMTFSNFNSPLLIPIPMHKNNIQERGYNQSELILKEFCKIDTERNFEISYDSFFKIKETPHQSKLKNKNERLKNLKDCFNTDSNKIKNRNIILIDDVITTGTTMREASKTLLKAGAKKVMGFSIAH